LTPIGDEMMQTMHAASPAITFAIPFYGSAEFLQRCLQSVQQQSRPDWEAIVVDDCSPGGDARAIVAGFDDARIRYERNASNLGLAGNWNRCTQMGSAPLLTLLHGDDELLPNYADLMVSAHHRVPGLAAIFCDAVIIDAASRPQRSFRDHVKTWLMPRDQRQFDVAGEAGFAALLRGNFIMCPTLCYRRDVFRQFHFSTRWRMVLDVEFYLQLLAAGHRFMGLRQLGYRYRRHDEQVTVECERNLRLFEEEARLWRQASHRAAALQWRQAEDVARRMRFVRLHLLFYLGTDLLRGQWRAGLEKWRLLQRLDAVAGTETGFKSS
jgi:glycosyltransferase involved in cell wall biosynthesis